MCGNAANGLMFLFKCENNLTAKCIHSDGEKKPAVLALEINQYRI